MGSEGVILKHWPRKVTGDRLALHFELQCKAELAVCNAIIYKSCTFKISVSEKKH